MNAPNSQIAAGKNTVVLMSKARTTVCVRRATKLRKTRNVVWVSPPRRFSSTSFTGETQVYEWGRSNKWTRIKKLDNRDIYCKR